MHVHLNVDEEKMFCVGEKLARSVHGALNKEAFPSVEDCTPAATYTRKPLDIRLSIGTENSCITRNTYYICLICFTPKSELGDLSIHGIIL